MENNSSSPPGGSPAKIVAASMAGSVIFFGILPVLGIMPSAGIAPNPALHGILFAIALGLLVLGPIISRLIYREKGSGEELLDKSLLAFILKFAIWEASALLGLVIYLTSGDTMSSAGFAFAALAAMMLNWPK